MFSLLYSHPCKSKLTNEEYKEYKLGFEDALQRCLAMDFSSPIIEFDDSCKHIVLRSFRGCIENNTIVIPDGITLVYVSDNEDEELLDDDIIYDLIIPDSVQSIDSLPSMRINKLDTNKLESIRLKDSDYDGSKFCIQSVIVRDNYKPLSSIGHLKTKHVYYNLTKPYKVQKVDTFIHDDMETEIHVNENCKSIKLGGRYAKVYVYNKELHEKFPYSNYVDKSFDDVVNNLSK